METPAPQTPDSAQQDEARQQALIAKHLGEIEPILAMPPEDREKKLLEYGLSSPKLAAYYENLQQREMELRKRVRGVEKQAATIGWISGIGTALVLGWLAVTKRLHESSFLRGLIVGVTSLTAGVAGNALGFQMLSGRVREDSRNHTLSARTALEIELANAIENKQIAAAAAMTPAAAAQSQPGIEGVGRPHVSPRAGYREEAMKEKAHTEGAQAGR